MKKINRRMLRQIVKVAVSAALLFVLIVHTNLQQLVAIVSSTPWWLIPSLLVLSFVSLAVSAKRWQILHGNRSLSDLFATSIVAQFYVFIVPTVLSGDVARVVKSTSEQTSGFRASVVVITDRLIGLISLLIAGLVSLAFTTHQRLNSLAWFGLVLLLMFASVLPVFVKTNIYPLERVKERLLNTLTTRASNSRSWLLNILQNVYASPFTGTQICLGMLWGLVFQVVVLLNLALIGYANQFPLSLPDYAMVSFGIQCASFVPIGIAGIGIKDLTQVSILGLFGIASGPALASSLVSLPVVVVIAAVGWILEVRK